MHPSLCWLIIHARLINAAQKTEWDQNNGCTWAFLLSLPSPKWLPPAGISAMGRDDSWNRARANVQAATSRPKQDWKVRGHEPPHTFRVCLCVCVCPTVRWKVYPAFQAFFRRSSSLSGLGWDFVSESTCLSWEAHSWEGDRGVGMCACRRGDVDIQMEVRSRRGGGRGWMNDMRGCKHMLEHEWSQT